MSQTDVIYDLFRHSPDPAADRALLMGLRRAQEPYRTSIFETLAESGRVEGATELVQKFHTYPQHWQDILVEKAERLHRGLRQGGSDGNTQTRLNALTIIKKSGYVRLTDMVAILLRDQDLPVAQTAGEVLIEQAIEHRTHFTVENNEAFDHLCDNRNQPDRRDHWIFISALQTALNNYKLHRRWESVFAAMTLVPATVDRFWENRLESYQNVGKVIRNILTNVHRAELVAFGLSALMITDLRPAVIRAIANNTRSDYLSAFAMSVSKHQNDTLRYALSMVKHPRWLDPLIVPPGALDAHAQDALVDLILMIGADDEAKIAYLSALCEEGAEQVGLKALGALEQFSEASIRQAYRRAVGSGHETVALAALHKLLSQKHSQLRRFLAKQLKSSHEQVKDLSRETLQAMIFNAYWKNFDALSRPQQFKAGQALFKINPQEAQQRWLEHTTMANPNRRVLALRVARILDRVETSRDTILKMTRDSHANVRSCAIAALGQVNSDSVSTVEPYLRDALYDRDARVQANAVEALEKLDLKHNAKTLEPLMDSKDNRLRANTIKALLNWKVAAAKAAIQKMVSDPSLKHRRSGLWVLRQTQNLLNIPKLLKKQTVEKPHVALVK